MFGPPKGTPDGWGGYEESDCQCKGAWQQAAQVQTDKSTDILLPPRSPARELTREEREKLKELPRPASATFAKPELLLRETRQMLPPPANPIQAFFCLSDPPCPLSRHTVLVQCDYRVQQTQQPLHPHEH